MPPKKLSVGSSHSKTMTTITKKTSDLKDELLKWICERHATNGPLDRQLLRNKALELAASLRVTGFKCSEAWLTVFLKKHGFSPSLTDCSGPIFPDYKVWIDLLRSLITQYRHKDLLNVDELIMYSDLVPAKISSSIDNNQVTDPPIDLSKQTNRIAMLLCSNSSGTEKLRPLIIGPWNLQKLPINCHYYKNENCCITDDLFADFLVNLNEEMSKSSRKILLLLSRERIRSLKNISVLSNVNLLFFPKDFPTQLRPLRGDIFHCVKMIHRSRYAEYLQSSMIKWKAEEIVDSLAQAWQQVPQELIVSSFQRTNFRQDESVLKIECPTWDGLGTGMSFRRFVTFDDHLSETSHRLSDHSKFINENGHRYNLRGNRRDTVDLDIIDEIDSNAGSHREVELKNQNENSSELRNKRRFTEEIRNEDHRNKQESRASETSGSNGSEEIIQRNTFIQRVGDLPDINNIGIGDTEELRSLEGFSLEEVNSKRDDTRECEASCTTRFDQRLVNNFPGEAGPSSKQFETRDETSGSKTSSAVKEFDDGDEEIPVAGQLKLTILEAIQYCKEIERSNDDDRIDEDDNPKTMKRARNFSNEKNDEPDEKRTKTADGSWSRRYETNFVFGTGIGDSSSKSMESLKKSQMHSNDERCIFGVDGNTPGVSCPMTKD